ncbi:ACT domain-containing protein [Candidatus Micrarchaeota archaeon]|nr:ACT domain-containing protein [Candidatus Micrarchaeota archaeon]
MPVSNLSEILKNLDPKLDSQKYYFATVNQDALFTLANYMQYIVCVFRENEGMTIVFYEPLKSIVEPYSLKQVAGPFAKLTLNVNSDMMSVGLFSKVTGALAAKEIVVNAFSGYFHDHLFVPFEKKDAALEALRKLS